jgi:hypothetical protein
MINPLATIIDMSTIFRRIFLAAIPVCCLVPLAGAQNIVPKGTAVALRASHPADSRGETVYQKAKSGESNVVTGSFHSPVIVELRHFDSNSLSSFNKKNVAIALEGVIAENGELIDITILSDASDPALAKRVAEAYSQSKFKPATVDGKPVAFLFQPVVNINFAHDPWHR